MNTSKLLQRIAILYQANPPPMKDGIQKPMKPGGYSDSGADIAFELIKNKFPVITPNPNPQIDSDFDWVFPDTADGIRLATDQGANIFWLNTILYNGHPIENIFKKDIEIIGQLPKDTDIYDDKWITNNLLRDHGLPVPVTTLISKDDENNCLQNLEYPLIVKPLRGRGSQGVFLVQDQTELHCKLSKLFSEKQFGKTMYVEKFLSGQEITITVMPPGKYEINSETKEIDKHWALPAVKRFNHVNGVAPWNGIVAVTENSCVLDDEELQSAEIKDVSQQCEKAAQIINAKAPIRIDARTDENEKYFIFDLNMKPNMTGASRPHRQNQDSLSALAARKIGWSFKDFLINMLGQKWKTSDQ